MPLACGTPLENMGGLVTRWPAPISSDQQGLTLLSDLHVGSRNTDYSKIAQELKLARRRSDRVLINGDIIDGILPQDRKRYSPSALHPRIQGCEDILNKCVDWAYEILLPYADLIDVCGVGNHDSSKHTSFDPVLALVTRLNEHLARSASSHLISYGGYCGLVIYRLGPSLRRFTVFYHHGWGKGASFSRAVSDYTQLSQWLEGVDLYWLGHLHSRIAAHATKIGPPLRELDETPTIREVRFVRTGAYLHTYANQSTESVNTQGRVASYGSDAAHIPYGLGGARVVVSAPKDLKQPVSVKVIQ